MKILVVDDNKADQELIAYELRGVGHCFFASSRAELIGMLDEGPFDCALLDYWVPGLGWPDSMHVIRARYPKTPCVVISGAILENVEGYQSVRDGADDFVLKRNMDMLPHVVRRVVIHRLAKEEREMSLSKIFGTDNVRDIK